MEQSTLQRTLGELKPAAVWRFDELRLAIGLNWLSVHNGSATILRLQGREQLSQFYQLFDQRIYPGPRLHGFHSIEINHCSMVLSTDPPELALIGLAAIGLRLQDVLEIRDWLATVLGEVGPAYWNPENVYDVQFCLVGGQLCLQLLNKVTGRVWGQEPLYGAMADELCKRLLTAAADCSETGRYLIKQSDGSSFIELRSGTTNTPGSLTICNGEGSMYCPLCRRQMVILAAVLKEML